MRIKFGITGREFLCISDLLQFPLNIWFFWLLKFSMRYSYLHTYVHMYVCVRYSCVCMYLCVIVVFVHSTVSLVAMCWRRCSQSGEVEQVTLEKMACLMKMRKVEWVDGFFYTFLLICNDIVSRSLQMRQLRSKIGYRTRCVWDESENIYVYIYLYI